MLRMHSVMASSAWPTHYVTYYREAKEFSVDELKDITGFSTDTMCLLEQNEK